MFGGPDPLLAASAASLRILHNNSRTRSMLTLSPCSSWQYMASSKYVLFATIKELRLSDYLDSSGVFSS
jgi:hypothetical protein